LTFLEEEFNEKWAGQMKRLLIEMKCAVEEAKQQGKRSLSQAQREGFERRYGKILKRGLRAESRIPALVTGKRGPKKQTKSKNLLDRLSRYRSETLEFMKDFAVPFDNNLAERDLRMMKVQQKISGSFRTDEGAKKFCRIRSYISTMRKQGHNALTSLKSVFAGRPIEPTHSG
jgi:transposase